MIVLLSGIPATGKSTYGRWLAETKGFVHVDVEAPGALVTHSLDVAWRGMFKTGAVRAFIDQVGQLGTEVAIDWGFPPTCLPVVRAIQAAGVGTWWFDGDRAAARRAFLARGTVSATHLDHQMAGITQHWCEIQMVFAGRIIQVIDSKGQYLPPGEIYAQMCGD